MCFIVEHDVRGIYTYIACELAWFPDNKCMPGSLCVGMLASMIDAMSCNT